MTLPFWTHLVLWGKSKKAAEFLQLRESTTTYIGHFGVKSEDIGADNAYFWYINSE